jgi:hypothetical protein
MVVDTDKAKGIILQAVRDFKRKSMLLRKGTPQLLEWSQKIIFDNPKVFKGSELEKRMASLELLRLALGKPSKLDEVINS